jgi:adenosylcobinamide-GDP ribazoletransferase
MSNRLSDWRIESIGTEFSNSAAFLTRLPADWFGASTSVAPDFSRASRAFPLVGLLVGVAGAIVLLLASALHLPPPIGALLAIAATVLVTGGLHEDGLADTADGFGGGKNAAAKLEIMRDSRIGTYGALALVFSIALRAGLLAALMPGAPWHAALALIAAETVGRTAIVHLWAALPPARFDGLASTTGRPDKEATWAAIAIAIVIGLTAGTIAAGPIAAIVALAATALTTYGFESLCSRQIGGQTGDTLGAVEQVAVVAFLLVLVAFA